MLFLIVPRENHDVMLPICKQVDAMFKQLGVLRYDDVSQLNNTDVPMEGFSNIAGRGETYLSQC